MNFLRDHWGIAVAALLLSAVFIGFENQLAPWAEWLKERAESSRGRWALIILSLLFYFFFYLPRPVYYAAYHGGSTGDNYGYARTALENPRGYNIQHYFHPYVTGWLLRQVQKIGFYNPENPHYLEKAFAFLSLPNRIAAFFGLWMMYAFFRRSGGTFFSAWLGAAWLAASFGYWFWTLQSNAMGFLLVSLVASLFTAARAISRDRPLDYAIAALTSCACMFVHISAIYIVAALGLFMGVRSTVLFIRTNDNRFRVGIAAFATVVLAGAAVFYQAAAIYCYSHKLSIIFQSLSDTNLCGPMSLGSDFVRRLIQNTAGMSMSMILGLMQVPGRSSGENGVIIFLLAFFFAWLASARHIDRPSLRDWTGKSRVVWLTFSVFVMTIAGFSLRQTWLQYLAPLAPTGIALLVQPAFHIPSKRPGLWPLWGTGIVLCLFFLNGFSRSYVYDEEKVDSQAVYRRLRTVSEAFPSGRVLYLDSWDTYFYNFDAVTNYYRYRGSLAHVFWPRITSRDDLPRQIKAFHGDVVVAERFYSDWNRLERLGLKGRTMILNDPEPYSVRVFHPAQ